VQNTRICFAFFLLSSILLTEGSVMNSCYELINIGGLLSVVEPV
jgi:hypothetical protein